MENKILYYNKLLLLTGVVLLLFLPGKGHAISPGVIPHSQDNVPAFEPIPYVITALTRDDRGGIHRETYQIILQTGEIPDRSGLIRTTQYLWQHRLPRDLDVLEVHIYLPKIDTKNIPYAALEMNDKGIQQVNIQNWVIQNQHGDNKHGLALSTRQAIFQKLRSIDHRADVTVSHAKQLKQALRTDFNISRETQQAIAFEGLANQWYK